MNDNSPGFIRQLPSALPGLALIIATLVVIRLWIEPWMAQTVLFGIKGWFVQMQDLNEPALDAKEDGLGHPGFDPQTDHNQGGDNQRQARQGTGQLTNKA